MQKKGYQRIVVDDKDVPFTGTGASRLIFYPDAWTGSWTGGPHSPRSRGGAIAARRRIRIHEVSTRGEPLSCVISFDACTAALLFSDFWAIVTYNRSV